MAGYQSFTFQEGQFRQLQNMQPRLSNTAEIIDYIDTEFPKHIEKTLNRSGGRFALFLTGALENVVLLGMLNRMGIKPDCYTTASANAPDAYYARLAAEHYGVPWHYIEYDRKLVKDSLPDILHVLQFPCHYTVGSSILINFCLQFARQHGHEHMWAGNSFNLIFGGGTSMQDFPLQLGDTFHDAYWRNRFKEMDYLYAWPDPVNMYGKLGEHYGIEFHMPWEDYRPIEIGREIQAESLFQHQHDLFPIREWAKQRLSLPDELVYRPSSEFQQTTGVMNLLREQMYRETPDLLVSHSFYVDPPAEDNSLDLRLWLSLRHEMQNNRK